MTEGLRASSATSVTLEARLVEEAANFYGVNPAELRSAKRGYHTLARWALIVVLTENVGWSENRTAKFLGKRVFAVQGGRKQALCALRSDPLFFEIVSRLREIVSPNDQNI